MLKKIALVLFSAVLLVSCSRGIAVAEEDNALPEMTGDIYRLGTPENMKEAFSYVFGYMLASSAGVYGESFDYQYMARGVLDYSTGSPLYSNSEMSSIASEYQRMVMAENQRDFSKNSEKNLEEAEEFLEINGQRRGVVTTDSGLQYEVMHKGNGPRPEENSTVTVHYTLTLLDGTLADSSYERNTPSEFNLQDVIPGFREGVLLMNEGSRYRLWVHPSIGYGVNPPSGIGPNSLLIFEVQLLDSGVDV